MNNAVATQTFSPAAGISHDIRIMTNDGAPWFVAADVCRALGLKDHAGSYTHHLRALAGDERRLTYMSDMGVKRTGRGGATSLVLIAESGLYKLVLRSDKAEARAFQDWATRIVLPSIRKTGSYVMGEEKLDAPDATADDLDSINDAIQSLLKRKAELAEAKVEALKAQLAAQAPKVAMVEDHYARSADQLITRFTRTLDGVNQNRVKASLLRGGYLWKAGDTYRVRAEYRGKLFVEKRHPEYQKVDIFLTPSGQEFMVEFHRQGGLDRKGA